MSVRWILPNLGTAPAMSASASEDTAVLDVRDLVDKGGNTSDAVLEKIKKGTALLREGKRVIVACDYRSGYRSQRLPWFRASGKTCCPRH